MASGTTAFGTTASGTTASGKRPLERTASGTTAARDARVPGNTLRNSAYAAPAAPVHLLVRDAGDDVRHDARSQRRDAPWRARRTPTATLGYVVLCRTSASSRSGRRRQRPSASTRDGTTWWGDPASATKPCQRWMSACVLARTNAYGVHVQISMRAPSERAAGDQGRPRASANATSATTFTLREGAFYGNIFATTPLNTTTGPARRSPTARQVRRRWPIISTPQLLRVRRPGQQHPPDHEALLLEPGRPESSSRCRASASRPRSKAGVCAGEDTVPASATFGAIRTATRPPPRHAGALHGRSRSDLLPGGHHRVLEAADRGVRQRRLRR